MKTSDVVMVAIGLVGLGLGGFALYRSTKGADLSQGPRAAGQPPPTATKALPPPQPAATPDLGKDLGAAIDSGLHFLEGLGGAVDSLGKFFDRF